MRSFTRRGEKVTDKRIEELLRFIRLCFRMTGRMIKNECITPPSTVLLSFFWLPSFFVSCRLSSSSHLPFHTFSHPVFSLLRRSSTSFLTSLPVKIPGLHPSSSFPVATHHSPRKDHFFSPPLFFIHSDLRLAIDNSSYQSKSLRPFLSPLICENKHSPSL